ncbi:shikimate dehydrogenase [Inquilinus sp. YAF38]|uniref:shikimate dehydrogenase family protein n=1 Tax=Inquilinus sp. YAF38 TaxID=3233084 RepID=UPI003F931A30
MTASPPATRPTLYFIGVTTGRSSIMTVFPAWARALGLGDAVIRGIDFPLHADPAAYREAVAFIRADPLSLGALVTTHKIDLFHACRDLFDEIDPHAARLDEVSCLSKTGGRLVGHAKDPISAGLAFDALVPAGHFARNGAELFSIGAGGAAIALTWHAMHGRADRPARIVVSDRSPERLDEIRRLHGETGRTIPVDYVLAQGPVDNDAALRGLKPGSVVVNATGLGKDAPGSPLTDAASFPQGGMAWDLNYRGDLLFLDQARRQQAARGLTAEDGWTYFIHGWTRAIAEVFHIEIPTSGPRFDELSRIAAAAARR